MKYTVLCTLLCTAIAANLRRSFDSREPGGATPPSVPRKDAALRSAATDLSRQLNPQTFKLTLDNHKGVQYTGPITLDDQTLSAVYDTGSFEIMAISRQCQVCKIAPHLTTYDNSTSKSFRAGHRPIEQHHFAGGTVVARQDFESVHVGTVDSIFKVSNMAFWQVVSTDMSVWVNKKANFTAIVGLGHRSAVPDTPENAKPMDSLIERTGTQRFSICLMRGPSNPGFLTFNPQYDLSSAGLNPMFRRIPVIGENHWAVALNSVSTVSNNVENRRCVDGQECIAIIDSGTSLIGVPPNAVAMVMDLINQVKYDCSNLDELPPLVFELAGQKFSMPGIAYTVQFGEAGGKPSRCLPAFTDFAMTSEQGTVWILGMPFLRHFYTVFDREEPSIYVADQGENCEPAAPPVPTVGGFVNATGLTGHNRHAHMQPTIADISQATLPSWAVGQKKLVL
jgi:hypothetical protein